MKKTLAIILAFTMTMLMLTACGSSGGYVSDGFYNGVDSPNESLGYGWDSEVAWDVDTPLESDSSDFESIDSTRKIIKNGSLDIETLDFDKFIIEFEASVSANGGYVESSSQRGNSLGHYSYRYANYTVRIPYDRYEVFMSQVGELGTVTWSDTYTNDVTLQYVDIEARLKALTAERDQFLELMDRAESIYEILEIQNYLTDVNYQIESYTSQFNTLKSLVSYSTVTVTVSEVERVTTAEAKTVWERISANLDENIYNISEGFKDVFVAIVSSTPYLLIILVFAGIILLIVFGSIKAANKKQQKRQEEYNKAYGFHNSLPQSDNNDKNTKE